MKVHEITGGEMALEGPTIISISVAEPIVTLEQELVEGVQG
jgi:hypothetical protein